MRQFRPLIENFRLGTPTLPLNDTGIETCYGASAPQSCAITTDYSRQDARFGRDPAYADGRFQKIGAGSASFDYTKIANDGSDLPADPFIFVAGTRTIGTGPFRGDQVLAIDSKPFSAGLQLHDAVTERHPGDTLRLTLSQPDGSAIEREVTIPGQALDWLSPSSVAALLARNLVIPIVSLVLGFAVALIRPRDRVQGLWHADHDSRRGADGNARRRLGGHRLQPR